MSFVMPEDLRDWAQAEVAAGKAASVEALAVAALEALRRRKATIKAMVDKAVEEAERIGWIDGDDLAAEIKGWIAQDEADAIDEKRLPAAE